MHSKLLRSFGLAALVAVSPIAVMAQDRMAPPPPADPIGPETPTQPMPPSNPPTPGEPMQPTQQPMPAPAPDTTTMPQPPVQQGATDAPNGPMATPPSSATDGAQSGGTTSSMMTPQPATKEYPLCTREIQDSCRNPGEGPKTTRKRGR